MKSDLPEYASQCLALTLGVGTVPGHVWATCLVSAILSHLGQLCPQRVLIYTQPKTPGGASADGTALPCSSVHSGGPAGKPG